MGLTLVAGPANAGKVALLLDRYVDAIDRNPVLIVPNRADVDRVERELLGRTDALLGGSIGTFDDVFASLVDADGRPRRLLTDAQRTLALRRVVAEAPPNGLAASARHAGFVDDGVGQSRISVGRAVSRTA